MSPRCLPLALVLAACMGNRPSLDTTVAMFHDDLRWARLPMAESVVQPALREAFRRHHRAWGTSVQIVDFEPEQVSLGMGRGTARVRVSWLPGDDSTELRDSVVEERWESHGGAWMLASERVVSGDPRLLAAVESTAAAQRR